MKIETAAEFQQLFLCRELVSRGLRTFVISSMTGIDPWRIKQLYKLEGVSPKVGQSPKTRTVCKSRMSQVRLSIFASIYLGHSGGKPSIKINPDHLISSYDIAQSLCPMSELDMTLAWSIATDLKIGDVDFVVCPQCTLGYLRIYGSHRLPLSCPFCALRERARRVNDKHAKDGGVAEC